MASAWHTREPMAAPSAVSTSSFSPFAQGGTLAAVRNEARRRRGSCTHRWLVVLLRRTRKRSCPRGCSALVDDNDEDEDVQRELDVADGLLPRQVSEHLRDVHLVPLQHDLPHVERQHHQVETPDDPTARQKHQRRHQRLQPELRELRVKSQPDPPSATQSDFLSPSATGLFAWLQARSAFRRQECGAAKRVRIWVQLRAGDRRSPRCC